MLEKIFLNVSNQTRTIEHVSETPKQFMMEAERHFEKDSHLR